MTIQCSYGSCKNPAEGELRGHLMYRIDREPWPMCAEHLRPAAHPRDLRDKLVKW